MKTVCVELDDDMAWSLAQFAKRVGFSDCRQLAVDDDEARQMIEAFEKLRAALAQAGCAPR